jgi:hypothetical protein
MEVDRKYNFKSKKSNDNQNKKYFETKKTFDTVPKKVPKKKKLEAPTKKFADSIPRTTQIEVASTNQPTTNAQKNVTDKSYFQSQIRNFTTFNLESELAKMKIHIPLTELMNTNAYISKLIKLFNIELGVGTNTMNVVDDQPEFLFGHEVEGQTDNGVFPPFYISLNIHDKTLHNAMLDFGASHNIMPKVMMEKLGLDTTRPYKDLYSFDSRKFKCIGLIKDLCFTLAQILAKSMGMDIVVANIPPNYGMLLSRSWGAKLKHTLQLDMSYATIPVFWQHRRLYRETLVKYMVNNQEKPHNYPLYYVHSDLDSLILYNDGDMDSKIPQLEDDVCNLEESKSIPEEGKEIPEESRTMTIQIDEPTKLL